ncbi:MAG: hypothetical protein COV47_02085 [Candidatus Diapherotrites archaeon CG11_big_fil_rev_8_21_14_0_20_37_9]|nr:MAG: hypothetical protein COV47_02085 [Candidatus Diapherotrites archaeon CG11_big_fil_rev_8_21_14_0_20_37_9]
MNSKKSNEKFAGVSKEEEEETEARKKNNLIPIAAVIAVIGLAGLGIFLGAPATTGLVAANQEFVPVAPEVVESQCHNENYIVQESVESRVPVTETVCSPAELAETNQKNPWSYFSFFPGDRQSGIIDSESTKAVKAKCVETTHFETVTKMEDVSKTRRVC